MSKPPTTTSQTTSSTTVINPQDYAHSPIHYAVALSDHATLTKLLNALPKLPEFARAQSGLTLSQSLALEQIADQISAFLDRRDNVLKETSLHLAVRLSDAVAVKLLADAGADASLQNVAGWNPLQEALLRRIPEIVKVLVQHHHAAAWKKWRRRLPRLVAALRRMRDFYMEIEFHFESSIVPFVNKIAPSDTYKIWKRDGNLRADTSLAGYDGLKIQRANQSFLFLNDCDDASNNVPRGSLIILNHDEKKIYDAFENAGNPLSDSDITNFCSQTSVYRPGMDVTKAELIGRTNWRRQEKTEHVGDYKARVYEMNNVTFTFRSRKLNNASEELSPTCVLPLEIDEESEEDFIVAENPRFSVSACNDRTRRHSSFVREDRDYVTVSRKSVDIIPAGVRRKVAAAKVAASPQTKEKEYAKNLRPTVWLTDHFPLKTEELTPLLDILANKVKAVRRLREVLTTTFPPGTFPVKVAIPVVPTVRVVITFTKFIDLQPVETFYTPMSSPRQLSGGGGDGEEEESTSGGNGGGGYFSSSWLRSGGNHQAKGGGGGGGLQSVDHFAMPSGYSWSSFDDKNRKMKKSKSIRRTK